MRLELRSCFFVQRTHTKAVQRRVSFADASSTRGAKVLLSRFLSKSHQEPAAATSKRGECANTEPFTLLSCHFERHMITLLVCFMCLTYVKPTVVCVRACVHRDVHQPVAQRLSFQFMRLEEPLPNPQKAFIHQTSAAMRGKEAKRGEERTLLINCAQRVSN